jgi:hypothetical protein
MGSMAQIARLATFVVALVLVVLAYVFDWFHVDVGELDVHVHLNPLPVRGSSGLLITACEGCPTAYTGRLPGGMAWLASCVALQFLAALAASAWQVLKAYRSPALTAWTTVSAGVLALLTLVVLWTFAVPRGFTLHTGPGPYLLLAACALALLGHARLFDRLD